MKEVLALLILLVLCNANAMSQTGSNSRIESSTKLTDIDSAYLLVLNKYNCGHGDSIVLAQLLGFSRVKMNNLDKSKLVREFISIIKYPLSKENLIFIKKMTSSCDDPGFELFLGHLAVVDTVLGNRAGTLMVQQLIYKKYIRAAVEIPNSVPNWFSIEADIRDKYGEVGNEIFLRSKAAYFLNEKRWNEFSICVKEYIDKFEKNISPDDLNLFAWNIFENIRDTSCLNAALMWSKSTLQRNPTEFNYIDTYANLLYKLGRVDEAIKWQSKAISLNEDNDLKITLTKMKNRQPTWQN